MKDEDRLLELRFAETMGRLFETGGLPRVAGRVWATFLVTDAPYLSARELQEILGASAGSISTATRSLVQFGLVDRISVPGERRDYFAPRRGAIAEIIRMRLERLTAMEEIVGEALGRFSDRGLVRERLEEIYEVYHWYAEEFPKLHERFLEERGSGGAREGRSS